MFDPRIEKVVEDARQLMAGMSMLIELRPNLRRNDRAPLGTAAIRSRHTAPGEHPRFLAQRRQASRP